MRLKGPIFRASNLPSASGIWKGERSKRRVSALAAGVEEAIANGADWLMSRNGVVSPLMAGDVAILCRSNDNCLRVADALAVRGVKVAIERDGLFGTLEARLALAALRWCADRHDTIALAELAHLSYAGLDQPTWFEASLRDRPADALAPLVPMASDLRAIAKNGVHKTPLEFVDSVLTLGGISNAVRRWGNVEDRQLNLEAFRELVGEYQEERQQSRAPTTASDLCAWLLDQEAKRPKSRRMEAVTVATYHASKGLEWNLVVLADLDDEPKGNPFGVNVSSDRTGSEIDWKDPLADRWLRFWPWPLGGQKKDVGLDVAAANSEEGKDAHRVERGERARLLYVGATRARDYLVLALPKSKGGCVWLDELRSDSRWLCHRGAKRRWRDDRGEREAP